LKIIALLPFRNEAPFLRTYISSVLPLVDQIVAVDHGSTDDGHQLLRDVGADVDVQPPPNLSLGRQLGKQRQHLLERGRSHGGTHFVWLDADEAFTAPFIENGRRHISGLKKGEKLSLQWLALWKNARVYRTDRSAWSNSWKDFIVHDDGVSGFAYEAFHEPRTNGPNDPALLKRVPLDEGAVLHFQFAAWGRFQMKQAWYRCWELIVGERGPVEINYVYRATLGNRMIRTSPLPAKWLEGIERVPDLENVSPGWYESEIMAWFHQYGAEFFEPLEIWHIPQLRQAFRETVGRNPRSHAFRRRLWGTRVAIASRAPWLGTLRRQITHSARSER